MKVTRFNRVREIQYKKGLINITIKDNEEREKIKDI